MSLATPQQIDTNKNRTVCASRPVLTSPIRYVIRLISGSSVRAGALSLTGYEPSLPLSAAFCVNLSSSVFIWAYLCPLCPLGSYLSHLCYLCLSRFLVGNYLRPFKFFGGELSAPIWVFSRELSVCFWDDLHWEASLHCISHLCGACWALALHPSEPIVLRIVSTFWA